MLPEPLLFNPGCPASNPALNANAVAYHEATHIRFTIHIQHAQSTGTIEVLPRTLVCGSVTTPLTAGGQTSPNALATALSNHINSTQAPLWTAQASADRVTLTLNLLQAPITTRNLTRRQWATGVRLCTTGVVARLDGPLTWWNANAVPSLGPPAEATPLPVRPGDTLHIPVQLPFHYAGGDWALFTWAIDAVDKDCQVLVPNLGTLAPEFDTSHPGWARLALPELPAELPDCFHLGIRRLRLAGENLYWQDRHGTFDDGLLAPAGTAIADGADYSAALAYAPGLDPAGGNALAVTLTNQSSDPTAVTTLAWRSPLLDTELQPFTEYELRAWVRATQALEDAAINITVLTIMPHQMAGVTDLTSYEVFVLTLDPINTWHLVRTSFRTGADPTGYIQVTTAGYAISLLEFQTLADATLYINDVEIRPLGGPFDEGIVAQSQPLTLPQTGQPTLEVQCENANNGPGFVAGRRWQWREWAQLGQPQTTAERSVYRRADGRHQTLWQRMARAWQLQTGYLPAHRHDALARALAHDDAWLRPAGQPDFLRLTLDDDYRAAWAGGLHQPSAQAHGLASATARLRTDEAALNTLCS